MSLCVQAYQSTYCTDLLQREIPSSLAYSPPASACYHLAPDTAGHYEVSSGAQCCMRHLFSRSGPRGNRGVEESKKAWDLAANRSVHYFLGTLNLVLPLYKESTNLHIPT